MADVSPPAEANLTERPRSEVRRLSLNTVTVKGTTLPRAAAIAAESGVPALGVWRSDVAELGTATTRSLLDDSGLRVSSLCFSGHVTSSRFDQWRCEVDDSLRAIDEAVAIGAPAVVFVPGGLDQGSHDVASARGRLSEALAELEVHARDSGVRIAVEPMHPMFFAEFGILPTLDAALEVVRPFSSAVGVVIDAFHTWWDPTLDVAIARAGAENRIAVVQLDDFVSPLAHPVVLSRGHLGDGHVDIRAFVTAIEAAGFTGDYEVEIFSRGVWAADAVDTVQRVIDDHVELVEPLLR